MQQQPQQQNPFQNQQQQRPQPLLQNPPSNQQQFPSQQTATNNPNLSLQTQNPLGINPTGVTQANSLDSWFALYAAALNPQVAQQPQQQQIQPQQDANSITQQWSQWLKTAQMVKLFKKLFFLQ
jgi:hypothetical protein